ncbi:tRNA uridine-5-carboxymethylaminomethyl(34) synthesis GTPase MnmE [Boseongicola aestuarii]|uniref:tRNA modification GTPase MnmE n=1 Tax=Boseongicola aestuarii TaxID=1470561 RepID=A0A238J3T5_9RHOB|nr:tRNA uridine-5-carboxymethylaminomethyl(34) synthesis GTPase MnmE [Boseongicola aestuarii]SMX24981.1 tRNA modification GTPase MnmE [Boseongicola aestuarii]
MDTIFALASARGKSGVAVVRISGPDAFVAVSTLATLPDKPRTAVLRTLRAYDLVLDEALLLTFPGPHSFTGEDVVELHLHGATATINAVLQTLAGLPGLRQAEPGEFTRRALENERLDLAQVEGLSDLIEAETEAQRRQALRVLSGALGDLAESWRVRLIRAAALLEATIDFADEEVPVDVSPEVSELLLSVSTELAAEIAGVEVSERIRDGFEVAIVGAPNVGKSSLLNALAGRDAAITSDIAGTTRDVIEIHMDLKGLPVTFLDTAGLRITEDHVEALGIERARTRAKAADLRIILLSSRSETLPIVSTKEDIVLVTKSDLNPDGHISVTTGFGLDDLVARVTEVFQRRASESGIAIRDRHRQSMKIAADALAHAQNQLTSAPELAEFIAEDLRTAVRALDALVGRVDVEHILDEIFSSFCIGK